MNHYKLEPISNEGSGIIRLGQTSVSANWSFYGLERWIETRCLDGSSWNKGILEYGKYVIWFNESVTPDQLPKIQTTVPLMIDEKKIGDDQTWWVITYLEADGKIGVELCNHFSG